MPTISPTTMPIGTLCTLRANAPAARPVRTPLKQDPTTMPATCERTSGVNHAVNPSKIPSTPPRAMPTISFFISLHDTINRRGGFLWPISQEHRLQRGRLAASCHKRPAANVGQDGILRRVGYPPVHGSDSIPSRLTKPALEALLPPTPSISAPEP